MKCLSPYTEPVEPQMRSEWAKSVARQLCRDSLAWAKTILAVAGAELAKPKGAGGDGASRKEQLFAEVLAYSLCLLEMRLTKDLAAGNKDLARRVRHECAMLIAQAARRKQNRHRRLPVPDPANSRYAQIYPAPGSAGRRPPRLTQEMFEQFCRCTGMESNVLVGKGENLATLVFYIAVHGVISADGLPSREAMLKLLEAARACSAHLQGVAAKWAGSRRTDGQLSFPASRKWIGLG